MTTVPRLQMTDLKVDFRTGLITPGKTEILKPGGDFINSRPTWTMDLHHSFFYMKLSDAPDDGCWVIGNLICPSQPTGIVFDMPEDSNTEMKGMIPPLGRWTRGRPWDRSKTSGGPTFLLELVPDDYA